MTEPPAFFEDVLDLLDALSAAGAEFLVVGAHALAAHGVPRATADFDVFVRPSAANATRVVRALQTFGAPLSSHGVSVADFEREDTVYQLGLPPRRIDILTGLSGVTFEEAWQGREEVLLEGRTLPVIGKDALIRNKRATGRDKDRLDADALEGKEP